MLYEFFLYWVIGGIRGWLRVRITQLVPEFWEILLLPKCWKSVVMENAFIFLYGNGSENENVIARSFYNIFNIDDVNLALLVCSWKKFMEMRCCILWYKYLWYSYIFPFLIHILRKSTCRIISVLLQWHFLEWFHQCIALVMSCIITMSHGEINQSEDSIITIYNLPHCHIHQSEIMTYHNEEISQSTKPSHNIIMDIYKPIKQMNMHEFSNNNPPTLHHN